jgi:hypothetical protein
LRAAAAVPWARVVTALALGVAGACLASGAGASDTQWWVADTPSDYAQSESRGVIVRPNGTLELGPETDAWSSDSLKNIWAVVPLADGTVAVGGDGGRIERWTSAGGLRPWLRLPVGQVLCLVRDGDGLLAGTGPEGVVYRIGARGDTARVVATGERYVWALAPAGRGAWWAATGTHGRLYRIEGGRARVALDTDESNLLSLAADGRGGVYAGGDSKGRVVHQPAEGRATTVYDASEDEIRALAIGADGAVYAAALTGTSTTAARETPSSDESDPSDEAPPTPVVRPAVASARASVYRVVPDSVATLYWSAPQSIVFALTPSPAGLLAATGNRAGIYRIERADGATQMLSAPEGQITALALGSDGAVWAAASNPGALWRLGPRRAARGELKSPTLDARRLARLGRLRWIGTAGGASVELHARSGNTDPPDTTWTEWRGGVAGEDGVRPGGPAARYFQWRLTLRGGEPRLENIEASWREQNVAPRVDDVVVSAQGQSVREGDLVPRAEPITQTLPTGQRVEYSLSPSPAPRALRELPVWARGLRTAQWRGSDANGDALRYRVEIQSDVGGSWREIAADLDRVTHTFDTQALPDGRYRLRVTASDALGNAVGEERRGEAVSAPFTVDNTPPVIESLAARGIPNGARIDGVAADATSPLSRLDVSVDDADWRPVTPEGGFTDARRHTFRVEWAELKPGDHSVSVRAVDLAGNSVSRATRVTVPGR